MHKSRLFIFFAMLTMEMVACKGDIIPPSYEPDIRFGTFNTPNGPMDLHYRYIDGYGLFGDIILFTPSQELPPEPGSAYKAAAVQYHSQTWPVDADGVVRIVFNVDSSLTKEMEPILAQSIDVWNNIFQENQIAIELYTDSKYDDKLMAMSETDLVRFKANRTPAALNIKVHTPSQYKHWLFPDEYRCSAATVGYFGFGAKDPELILSKCPLESGIHEIGHILGLYHTHQRTDRGTHIEILWHNIPLVDGIKDEEQYDQYRDWQTLGLAAQDVPGVPYDLASIMHYATDQKAEYEKDEYCPLIVRRFSTETGNEVQTINNTDSSGHDLIGKWDGKCPTAISNEPLSNFMIVRSKIPTNSDIEAVSALYGSQPRCGLDARFIGGIKSYAPAKISVWTRETAAPISKISVVIGGAVTNCFCSIAHPASDPPGCDFCGPLDDGLRQWMEDVPLVNIPSGSGHTVTIWAKSTDENGVVCDPGQPLAYAPNTVNGPSIDDPPSTCQIARDCGADITSDPVCNADGNVEQARTSYACTNGVCSSSRSSIITTCSMGCTNGTCVGCMPNATFRCASPSGPVIYYDSCGNPGPVKEDCGASGYIGSPYCQGNNVYRDYANRGCSGSSCTLNVTPMFQRSCTYGCTSGSCDLPPSCGSSVFWNPTSMIAVDSVPAPPNISVGLSAEFEQDIGNGNIKFRVCKNTGTLDNALHVQFYESVKYTPSYLMISQSLAVDASERACTVWAIIGTGAWAAMQGLGGDVRVVSPSSCSSAWNGTCSNPDPGCGYCWFMSSGIMTRTCKGL